MGRFRVPSDLEIQALLDKERAERERRNKELLGEPTETLEEVQFRKAALLQAGEMALLESEEIHEAELKKTMTAEEEYEFLPQERWEVVVKSRAFRALVLMVVCGGLCAMSLLYQQWIMAIGNLSLLWGWYYFHSFWKNTPKEAADFETYNRAEMGSRRVGWYFCAIGISAEIIAVFGKFVMGFVNM